MQKSRHVCTSDTWKGGYWVAERERQEGHTFICSVFMPSLPASDMHCSLFTYLELSKCSCRTSFCSLESTFRFLRCVVVSLGESSDSEDTWKSMRPGWIGKPEAPGELWRSALTGQLEDLLLERKDCPSMVCRLKDNWKPWRIRVPQISWEFVPFMKPCWTGEPRTKERERDQKTPKGSLLHSGFPINSSRLNSKELRPLPWMVHKSIVAGPSMWGLTRPLLLFY